MANYQRAKSSLEISMGIADFLQLMHPRQFYGRNRAKVIREVNDTIQGRSKRTVEQLLDELREKGRGWYPHEIERFGQEIAAFQAQKKLLTLPYTKCGDEHYAYQICDKDLNCPLKIIDQKLYDRGAKDGFPPDFFCKSYFDRVEFYCLPDGMDMSLSEFHNCTFAVCRLHKISFVDTRIYDCVFHSCDFLDVDFSHANLAHPYFSDCVMRMVSFQGAAMRRVYTRDCIMDGINFRGAFLDGCAFHCIRAKAIKNLSRASITHSGATKEEVEDRKQAIFRALRVPFPSAGKHKRTDPER